MTERSGFHAHSGWYFRRNSDGTVTIYADATEDGHPREVTFEPSTWASIVASVSSEGETSATYREALALHTREP
ncbi:MAG TPA: hypothetical protein VHA75_11475, partial [Rugosimonospora sp.]|nr:hypothetical protein [Rugosimonospora sp.]